MPKPTACALNPASMTAFSISCSVSKPMPSPGRHTRQTRGRRAKARTRALDDAAADRDFEALAIDRAAKDLLSRVQALHYRLHRVARVGSEHHEASLA